MITKLFIVLFAFSFSLNVFSAPIAADCLTHSGVLNEIVSNQCGHDGTETLAAKDQHGYSDKAEQSALAHVHLREKPPSLAETLMAMFFIPGLILLWFSRFTKSSK